MRTGSIPSSPTAPPACCRANTRWRSATWSRPRASRKASGPATRSPVPTQHVLRHGAACRTSTPTWDAPNSPPPSAPRAGSFDFDIKTPIGDSRGEEGRGCRGQGLDGREPHASREGVPRPPRPPEPPEPPATPADEKPEVKADVNPPAGPSDDRSRSDRLATGRAPRYDPRLPTLAPPDVDAWISPGIDPELDCIRYDDVLYSTPVVVLAVCSRCRPYPGAEHSSGHRRRRSASPGSTSRPIIPSG